MLATCVGSGLALIALQVAKTLHPLVQFVIAGIAMYFPVVVLLVTSGRVKEVVGMLRRQPTTAAGA